MIKTLRITGIIAAVLAAVFIVFPAVFGISSDKQSEQFLSSAGVIEKFNEAKGDRKKRSESQVSPLVKQANAFALYLNPPPKPKERAVSPEQTVPRRPPTVSPKFRLIGTSCYMLHPELSMALIDEPGKGFRWVRQESSVGHLIIEQVKDGAVVVRDGKGTFELTAERQERRSLVKGAPRRETGAGATSGIPPQMSDEEEGAAWAEKIFAELEAMQESIGSGEIDSEPSDEESEALMEKSISDLKSMRISSKEAKRLDHLGKELSVDEAPEDAKGVGADPNRARDRRAKRQASLRDPNRAERK